MLSKVQGLFKMKPAPSDRTPGSNQSAQGESPSSSRLSRSEGPGPDRSLLERDPAAEPSVNARELAAQNDLQEAQVWTPMKFGQEMRQFADHLNFGGKVFGPAELDKLKELQLQFKSEWGIDTRPLLEALDDALSPDRFVGRGLEGRLLDLLITTDQLAEEPLRCRGHLNALVSTRAAPPESPANSAADIFNQAAQTFEARHRSQGTSFGANDFETLKDLAVKLGAVDQASRSGLVNTHLRAVLATLDELLSEDKLRPQEKQQFRSYLHKEPAKTYLQNLSLSELRDLHLVLGNLTAARDAKPECWWNVHRAFREGDVRL